MSLSILVDNEEALISFSCTFLSNGSDLTQSHFGLFNIFYVDVAMINYTYMCCKNCLHPHIYLDGFILHYLIIELKQTLKIL
ncbi:hypothetical protein BpHYR1_011953 [Brachionus plicatilis]|uniref:Uncharacterized protein n=1 Tax=Brachionus plicatilis TaxID=10195 RepID=A0A3M7Q7R8_BRAPC|nr:hypothetical protein BpHYR1_011953 [Brachionus plicatilis]